MQFLAGLHRPALPDRLALFRQFAHALARYARRRDFSRPLTHRTRLALFFRRKRAGVWPPVRRGWQIFDLSNLRPRPCRLPPARRGHAHTRGLVTRARRLATGRRVDTRGFGRPALGRRILHRGYNWPRRIQVLGNPSTHTGRCQSGILYWAWSACSGGFAVDC